GPASRWSRALPTWASAWPRSSPSWLLVTAAMRRADRRGSRSGPLTVVALGLLVAAACRGADRPTGVVQGTMSAAAAPGSTLVAPEPAEPVPATNPAAPAGPGTTTGPPANTTPSD